MGLDAFRVLAQAAQGANNTALLVAVIIASISGLGGIIAGLAAFANNRRQRVEGSRTGVREDVKVVLEANATLIKHLQDERTALVTGMVNRDVELAERDAEIDRLREELRKCRDEGSPRRGGPPRR